MRIRRLFFTTAILASLCFVFQSVRADEIIVGSDTSNNYIPIGTLSQAGDRYQQVNTHEAFGNSSVTITRISFQASVISGTPTGSFNLRLGMSTTAVTPTNISSDFAANRGSNFLNVFSGAITFTPTTNNPNDFDIVIDLTTPFLYDPLAGNLLFEIEQLMNPQLTGGGFALVAGFSQQVGRNYATSLFSGTDPGYGAFVRFTTNEQTTPTPEPATMFLLGSGLAGASASVRRRRRAKEAQEQTASPSPESVGEGSRR